jgi:hypothetical protein
MRKKGFFCILQKSLTVIICSFFLIFAGIIFLSGIFNWNGSAALYNEMNWWIRGCLLLCAVTAVFLIFTAIKEFSEKLFQKINPIYIYLFLGILILLLQIVFLFCSKSLLRYDALNVYDEAVSIFYDGEISAATKEGYFTYYTNNYMITAVTHLFLKAGRLIHLVSPDFQNGMLFLQIINMLAIDTAFLFGFLFVRDFTKNPSTCFCYLVFTLVSPLTYVWLPFYYTNTLSMPFYVMALWLLYRYFLKNDIFCLLAGVLLGIGYAIRPTVVITIIAVGIVILCFINKMKKRDWIRFCALLLGVIISQICVVKPLTGKYVKFDYTDTAFPAIHWIMMGAGGEGTYNKKDEAFTASFETAQDKKNADKEILQERLQELGVSGIITHSLKKMNLSFSDGTGNYAAELSMSENYGKFYQYVYGDKNQGFLVYIQIMYLSALLYALIAAAHLLRKREFHPMVLVLLNLLGGFFFYMIWESGAVYYNSFLPLFYIALAGGVEFSSRYVLQKSRKRVKGITFGLGVIVLIAESVWWIGNRGNAANLVYQVNQFMFQTDHYQPCSEGIILQQTFKSKGTFDKIAIQARNPLGGLNDSIYRIELENAEGEICGSFRILSADIIDYEFVRLSLEEPMEAGDYKLILKKESGDDDITWLYYDTGNYDVYKQGELTGFPVNSTMDLTFKIYCGEDENYFDQYKKEL